MAPLSGNNNGSLAKWVISVVASAIIWLAASTVSNVIADIKILKDHDAITSTQLAVLNIQYIEIIRRLGQIDGAIGELNVPRRVYANVVTGKSTAPQPPKTDEEVLNGK